MVRRQWHSRTSGSKARGQAKVSRYDRIDYLKFFFLACGAIIALRLFVVQVAQHGYYDALATDSHELFKQLFPERGEILVHDRYSNDGVVPIATNKVLSEVHAVPSKITNVDETASALSPLLNISVSELKAKLGKVGDPDELLKRRVPEEVVNAINKLELPGIEFRDEQWRYYPEGEYMAHITGYYGYSENDKAGKYGLEGYFDKDLAGQAGYISGEKDALGRFLTIGDNFIQEAVDGTDLVLTVDKNIQFFACDKLKSEVERLSAKNGSLIIMQPDTGAIMAMCNVPTFDPNKYNEVESIEAFTDIAVSSPYEPGSVFKGITMAAGLDAGVVNPSTTYNDGGEVRVAGYPIQNFDGKAYGTQNMTTVLEKSLNLGTIFVVQQLGNEPFYNYVKKFGFGEVTDVELSNEQSGGISSLESFKDVYAYTGSFGHGITVTPLQMVTAYAALANNGTLMKPYIVEKKIGNTGAEIPTKPTVVRQAVSADAARTVTAMLVNVIDRGTAVKAGVPGYFLAGKTGTSLIVNANGRYDASLHNDTMVGYGPVSDPKFVMLIKMDQPRSTYAEGSVVPVWGQIAKYVLNYLQIPPDRN